MVGRSALLRGEFADYTSRLEDTDLSPAAGRPQRDPVSGQTTITLPLSPRMALLAGLAAILAAAAVAAIMLRPAPPHARAGELAATPGLNGDWWFDEIPWFVPGLRAQLYDATGSGESVLGGKELAAVLARSRSGDVVRIYDDLRQISDDLRGRLPAREAEIVGLLWRIRPENHDEKDWIDELAVPAERLEQLAGRTATEEHLLAVLQHRRGRAYWQEAETAYRAAIGRYEEAGNAPLVARCRCDYGQLLLAEKKLNDSLAQFQKSREAFPAPTLQFVSLLSEGQAQRARGGYLPEALELFQQAEKMPSIPNVHPLRSYLHEQRGWTLLDAWRLKEAEASFDRALKERSDEIQATNDRLENPRSEYFNLWNAQGKAMTAHFRGEFAQARDAFRELNEKIERDLDAGPLEKKLTTRQKSEYKQRRSNIYERWADTYLCGDWPPEQAERQLYLNTARDHLRSCYEETRDLGFDRDERAPHVLRIRYKQCMATALADGSERARQVFADTERLEAKMKEEGVFNERYEGVYAAAKALARGIIDIADREDPSAVTRGAKELRRLLLEETTADADKVSRRNINIILLGFELLAESRELDDDAEDLHRLAYRFRGRAGGTP
jgi:tetratricopeptide (TPR) repeat protein